MRNLIFIISVEMLALCSCGDEKVPPLEARNFYDSINTIFYEDNEVQQNLIDRLTEALWALKEDENRTFDTKPLLKLLDQAKNKNNIAIAQLEAIEEVDKKINYKEKVLTYYRLFEGFLEMVSAPINLLGKDQEDRGEKISTLILPPLQRIKEQEIKVKEAQIAFEQKYPLDDNGNIKTGTEFEYVRFTNYQYETTDLKEGENILLLSYSGSGRECSLDTMYYRQFIGIIEATGDTVRILSPCQDYDIEKAPRECYFQAAPPPEVLDLITSNNSFIVFNKHQGILEKQNFKTAFGTLQFPD